MAKRKRRDFNLFEPAQSEQGRAPNSKATKSTKFLTKPSPKATSPTITKAVAQQRISDTDYMESLGTQPSGQEETSEVQNRATKDYRRHTFIIRSTDLVDLREIVHLVKSSGRYTYSQKEALHEAIQLLKKRLQLKKP